MWNNRKNTLKPPMVREALCEAVSYLRRWGIPHPRLEAEVLLAALLATERTQLLFHLETRLTPSIWAYYQESVEKRGGGYPLQYLIGKQEFMSLEFQVNPAVLIPRSDTEVLVEKALSYRQESLATETIWNIVDVGTGSGAIGVSLAYYWSEARVTAVDISPAALVVARENAQKHGVKLELILGDLLTPFTGTGRKFQLIISNPPYIATPELPTLPPDVQQEPQQALDGGPDGLDYYRRLIPQASLCLAPEGVLALEIGWQQGKAVKELLQQAGFHQIEIGQDYGGRDRIITATKE